MDLEQQSFDPEVFFSTFWRKRPMYIRGGAAEFLGRTWSDADFATAHRRALASGHPVAEREDEVTFIERVSEFDEDLAARAARFRTMFGLPKIWFDSVRTHSPSGIGAHFDHSDNFVLQQSGVKEWSLAAPSHISKETIVRRMMNYPGVGGHPLPDEDIVHFTVEPGDLLYIPLLWLHSGVSHAESLSISLVCPAVSLNSAVMPFLAQVMQSRGLGHQPIPALHSGLSEDAHAEAVASISRATRALLSRMSDDDLAEAVLEMQSRHL
ncbi:MAG TPA: cupin domain-containing protein [Actinomycetales bacterium]|nr:cupin domain-containing protein [Actinomycetales bacterium]